MANLLAGSVCEVAQPTESVAEHGRHRLGWKVEELGDLADGVPVVIGQRDGGLAALVAHGRLAWDGVVLVRRPQGAGSIDGHTVGLGKDPADGAATGRVKTRRVAPHLDQRLLGCPLGLRRIPHDRVGQAVHLSGDAVVQAAERILVAAGDVTEQPLKGWAGRPQQELGNWASTLPTRRGPSVVWWSGAGPIHACLIRS